MSLKDKVKSELNSLGIRPKKSLGQNFLINENVYIKITEALELKSDDTVIEIGPGLGTLTEYLANSEAKIIAVEKDDKLSEHLRDKFEGNKNVIIINEDILNFNLFDTKYQIQNIKYNVVGNIPYYLTSRLIKTIFESANWRTASPEFIVLMVQKEVAQRITARPPKMSLLSVSVQYYAEPKIISKVPRTSFYPQPEVDSALIRLTPHARMDAKRNADGREKKTQPKEFFKIVKAGFSEKRKKLSNNLSKQLGISKQKIIGYLESSGIDPSRRAETLTIKEWGVISKYLSKYLN